MNPSLKRPRSPSPYFAHLSADRDERLDSAEAPLVRSIEALEAQLCGIERLARQVEGRGDQVPDGRLIRLNEHHQQDSSNDQAWVDRYDARLLLSPPPFSSTNSNLEPQIISPPPNSPTGFSDLPSDHEEMFYFNPKERLEIAQKKLRRKRDDERSFRIKMREEQDKQLEEELRLSKIPPSEQIKLMTRTLEALNSSPSPSLLEIRILTNHGNDPRFSSFLRKDGKWSSYWETMKANQSQQVHVPEPSSSKESLVNNTPSSKPCNIAPSAGLVDYDDSSSENEKEHEEIDGKSEKNPDHHDLVQKSSNPKELSNSTQNLSDPPTKNQPSTTQDDLPCTPITNESLNPQPDGIILDSQTFLDLDSVNNNNPSVNNVNPIERLNRQQRAKLWAEKRRNLNHTTTSKPS